MHYGLRRNRHRALNGVSLSVAKGETVGMIGETGSGKSTFARAALGLVRSAAGKIAIDGGDVTRYTQRQWRALRRRGVVQYVFQDPLRSLDPDLAVAESLTEPLLIQGVSRTGAIARARAYLALVFISHDLGSVAGVADRIAVLYQDELVEVGDTRSVINSPQHICTRLLVSSAPTLHSAAADRAQRDALRALLQA